MENNTQNRMEKDFNIWIEDYKPDWKEVAWQCNTGRNYQKKQDLVAVFWNSYIMIEAKFNDYFKHFKELPEDVFNELIYKFRQSFPKSGRIDGINYFDDLLEMLIDKYSVNIKKQQKKTSYVWKNNPDKELPELYSLMIDKYNLIAPETTYEHFKAVFTGQLIDVCPEPIKWLNTNRLLAYFLDEAFKGQDWQSIAGNGKLFLNSKLKIITANDLSVAKKGYSDFGKPKGNQTIDLILKTIKKHSLD